MANILAAGDVIGFPALAATSMEQGRVAICNAFGFDYKKSDADKRKAKWDALDGWVGPKQ